MWRVGRDAYCLTSLRQRRSETVGSEAREHLCGRVAILPWDGSQGIAGVVPFASRLAARSRASRLAIGTRLTAVARADVPSEPPFNGGIKGTRQTEPGQTGLPHGSGLPRRTTMGSPAKTVAGCVPVYFVRSAGVTRVVARERAHSEHSAECSSAPSLKKCQPSRSGSSLRSSHATQVALVASCSTVVA